MTSHLPALRAAIDEAGGLATACESEGVREMMRGAWAQGWATELLCDEGQRAWIRAFREGKDHAVWLISRQRGKSFAALAMAVEDCFARPDTVVRYAALTGKSALAIVVPTLTQILATMPEDARPAIKDDRGTVLFANGSSITWAGTDNEQFDRLRGPRAHLILLDESAFYADLEAVESALLPQLTTTGGKALYLSTPPESPAHPFVARYRAAQAAQSAFHATIHDNPRLGPEGVRQLIRREAARLGMSEAELVASTYWRREYLAEIVTETSRAAIRGWTEEVHRKVVLPMARPQHFDGYTSLDFGFGDGHGALFCETHFEAGLLNFVDELVLRGKTTADLADEVKRKETELWGVNRFDGTLMGAGFFEGLPEWMKPYAATARDAPRQPFMRVGDNDPLVLADLARLHGVVVLPTQKHDKESAVDEADVAVRTLKIRIHPRCVNLIRQLYSTLWNKRRTEWERSADGHGELIDCFVYAIRNWLRHRDPRPKPPADEFQRSLDAMNGKDRKGDFARALLGRRG